MRRIVKSTAPGCLAAAKDKGWNWDDFFHNDHDGHTLCTEQAGADQGGVCGYTELPLWGKGVTKHLDHYRKKAIYPKLTFDWNNLVCAAKDNRFGADHKDKLIDGRSAETTYAGILNPVEDEAQDYFYYDTDGKMIAYGSLDEEKSRMADETIRVFNLNETELVSRRRSLIAQLRACADLEEEDIRASFAAMGFPSVLEQELRMRQ